VENLTVEAHAKTASGWLDLGIKREIPLSILDSSISVPEPDLPVSSMTEIESMQVACEGSQIS
jgi:hypothetical protein